MTIWVSGFGGRTVVCYKCIGFADLRVHCLSVGCCSAAYPISIIRALRGVLHWRFLSLCAGSLRPHPPTFSRLRISRNKALQFRLDLENRVIARPQRRNGGGHEHRGARGAHELRRVPRRLPAGAAQGQRHAGGPAISRVNVAACPNARVRPRSFAASTTGVAKFGGCSYQAEIEAGAPTIRRPGGYQRLKLHMSWPLRTAHRTCSKAFAPSRVQRMWPLRFMRCPMTSLTTVSAPALEIGWPCSRRCR